jgi:hypothetical protein
MSFLTARKSTSNSLAYYQLFGEVEMAERVEPHAVIHEMGYDPKGNNIIVPSLD